MILLEAKDIVSRIRSDLASKVGVRAHAPRLGVIVVGQNPVSEKFLLLKEKFAASIGVETRRYSFDETISAGELRTRMNDIVHESANAGIIVQLPLPKHIDAQSILNAVTPEKDVDVLSARSVGNFEVGKSKILPPVVSAVKALFDEHKITLEEKKVVVIGHGKLAGRPLATWVMREGGVLTIISSEKNFRPEVVQGADIVVSGVGKAGLIKSEMIKEGAVVVDVGTSEQNGEIVGDVDFESVSKKAAYLTPVIGGVGPLTVAFVFQNLLTLLEQKTERVI